MMNGGILRNSAFVVPCSVFKILCLRSVRSIVFIEKTNTMIPGSVGAMFTQLLRS
jgi:hypothetical protein